MLRGNIKSLLLSGSTANNGLHGWKTTARIAKMLKRFFHRPLPEKNNLILNVEEPTSFHYLWNVQRLTARSSVEMMNKTTNS